MNIETVSAIVYQDLVRSELGEFFRMDHVDGPQFEVLVNADGAPILLIDGVLSDGSPVAERGQAMCAWRFRGRNTVAVPGMKAADNVVVTIEGVSYVDYVLRGNAEEVPFPGDGMNLDGIIVRRFIDWGDVYAQLGSLPGRQVTPTT